jgi:hypothetical protein
MIPVTGFTIKPVRPSNVPFINPIPPYYFSPYLGLLKRPTNPLLKLEIKLFEPCLMPFVKPFG